METDKPLVEIDEAAVIEKWVEISPLIDKLVERTGNRDDFAVAPGSCLFDDDRESAPYHVSHAVRMAFTAGIDHLHAVKQLVVEGGVLHVAAPFSLARGALETFAAAFWILHPTDRDDRITRALRWYMQNLIDQNKVTLLEPGDGAGTFEEKKARIYEIAKRRELPREAIGRGYTSTAALDYVDENSSTRVKFAWQLCSGFAHGRPWAYLGASERKEFEADEPGVHHIQMTSNLTTTLYPTLQAIHLLQDVLRLYTGDRAPRGASG